METYKIIRFFQNGGPRTISRGNTLEEARAWCGNPETSSSTAKGKPAQKLTERRGPWFDGYDSEGKK
jgi:hypothetical protein